jgi:purine-binding chemotaxis protein CheW
MAVPTGGGESPPKQVSHSAYLTLHLGLEDYAIPTERVRVIMRLPQFTPFTGEPSLVRGVMDIRDRTVPILDLRMKMGRPPAVIGPRTAIVVVDLAARQGLLALRVGLLVDRVSQVFRFAGPIDPAPDTSPAWLVGTGRVKRRLKTVIDLDEMITQQDLESLTAAVR